MKHFTVRRYKGTSGAAPGAAPSTAMPPRPRRPRLAEVARAAGVSAASVSRLMSGKARVAPATRQRIVAAAGRLGFDLARGRQSRIIAFLLSNRNVLHPFHSAVLVGAEAYCAEHDYALLFLPYHYPAAAAAKSLSLPEILRNRRTVSGAIVAGTNSAALLERLTTQGLPWVALGNNILGAQGPWNGAVYFDDIGGAEQLTKYLIGLGHRRVGFAGNLRLPWYARRFQGYQAALAGAGLTPMLGEVHTREGEEMGYVAAKLLLQRSAPPTAIFAGDDSAARGVYLAARDCGLEIPRQLSVAGFNDTLEAAALHPKLTSVRVFTEELGKQLAETLLQRIERPDSPPAALALPTLLIQRESCGPAPPHRRLAAGRGA